jgi:hypothetical protein
MVLTSARSGSTGTPRACTVKPEMDVTRTWPVTVAFWNAVREMLSPARGTGVSVEGSTATKTAGPACWDWRKKPDGSDPTAGLT